MELRNINETFFDGRDLFILISIYMMLCVLESATQG